LITKWNNLLALFRKLPPSITALLLQFAAFALTLLGARMSGLHQSALRIWRM